MDARCETACDSAVDLQGRHVLDAAPKWSRVMPADGSELILSRGS